MWNYMDHSNWGGMGFGMGFGMILFWAMIIVALIVLFRGSCGNGNRKTEKSALDILKERYARGEIGREEFEQIKRDLEN